MLEGHKINLRLLTEADVEECNRLENVYKEQGESLPPGFHTLAERKKQYEEKKGLWDEHEGMMAIETKDGRLVGCICFFRRSPHLSSYEIGFGIYCRDDRNQGYLSEALRIFAAYLFELKPVPRLEIMTLKDNLPARRVAEKSGFQLEGTFRKRAFVRGEYRDLVFYGLLREDCPPLKDALP